MRFTVLPLPHKALEDLHPDYVAASFDVSKATFRTEQYAQYKATRVKADQELYDQIPRVKELLFAFNIPIYEKEGYEADDCIGTIVSRIQNTPACRQGRDNRKQKYTISPSSSVIPVKTGIQKNTILDPLVTIRSRATHGRGKPEDDNNEGMEVYIISGDKDIYQLIDGNIFVYSLRKGLSQMSVVDRKVIKEEYGDPEDFIDSKASRNASDNIPGVQESV